MDERRELLWLLRAGRVWALSGPQELSGAAAAEGEGYKTGGAQGCTPPPLPLPFSEREAPAARKGLCVPNVGPPISLDLGLWLERSVGASWPDSGSHPRWA